ncbi:hypothetical protein J1614_011436 [Plenodomus biglobosus]|nr:hypothetical protein J1614_011436 [Plenodomus biglobosus]
MRAAMTSSEFNEKLGLDPLRQQAWYLQSVCALSGDGLYEGLVSYDCFRKLTKLDSFTNIDPMLGMVVHKPEEKKTLVLCTHECVVYKSFHITEFTVTCHRTAHEIGVTWLQISSLASRRQL